jgi:DNA-directed RNA polymerase specialized sigma24 family protein
MLFPRSRRELRESELAEFEDGNPSSTKQQTFSDAVESPFADAFTPSLKQTAIFIDRFFFRKSYAEMAEKYSTTVSGVAKLYVNAKDRIFKTVEAMDRIELAKNNGTPLVSITQAVRAFLLHSLFGLSNIEISRLLGVNHSLIHRYLTVTRDRLICGELKLFAYSDEDRKAAQGRLDEMRRDRLDYDRNRKRRERRAK